MTEIRFDQFYSIAQRIKVLPFQAGYKRNPIFPFSKEISQHSQCPLNATHFKGRGNDADMII